MKTWEWVVVPWWAEPMMRRYAYRGRVHGVPVDGPRRLWYAMRVPSRRVKLARSLGALIPL